MTATRPRGTTPLSAAEIPRHSLGERLVLPAGPLKVRSNDCDYRSPPTSAFAHQTGLGIDEPDAVLTSSLWRKRGW